MGRKSQSKLNARSQAKENKIIQKKRKELNFLVNKLLTLTSVFKTSMGVVKSWEHHLEIVKILKDITQIENSFDNGISSKSRHLHMENFLKWMTEHGAQYEGLEIAEFEGYDLGIKATKMMKEDSLLMTIPRKVMISEQDARNSELGPLISADPLLNNMPNIMLALFLLLEKTKTDSFWKPYIDVLPEKYTTILYFTTDELIELKPSPVFELSLKLYRSIARQYAYFFNKIHTLELPVMTNLKNIFTFDNYRWAVSTVMTRQNNLHLSSTDTTAFIPLWDMCNHEHGKITTDFNKELNRGECYALRDYQPDEQVFIFYGGRPNSDLFLHNGFVYPDNQHDSLSLLLGISLSEPLRASKLSLLNKLGLKGATYFNMYKGKSPISPELLAFIRIFNMNQDELDRWLSQDIPSDLVSSEESSSDAVGATLDRRAYTYLLTRCELLKSAYEKESNKNEPETVHRKNIILLKKCEVQILNNAIQYLHNIVNSLST